MPKAEQKNKGGRPEKEFDKKEFEKLCGLQCTKEEICCFFDTTANTLENWCKRTYGAGFSQVFKEKRCIGNTALRRYQFQLAKKNASMAIFLGKNMLGQRDNPGEPTDAEKIMGQIQSLAEIIQNPHEDRDIRDFESEDIPEEGGKE